MFSDSSFGTNAVIVAHSQGGLVSRLAIRTDSVRGLITIGTPHQGAPIAGEGGTLFTLGEEITGDDGLVYDLLGNACADDAALCDNYDTAFELIDGAVALATDALDGALIYTGETDADITDMEVGSPTIDSFETQYYLEKTGSRYSIVVDDVYETLGPFRLWEDVTDATTDADAMSWVGSVEAETALDIQFEDDPEEDPDYTDHSLGADALFDLGIVVNRYCSDIWNEDIVGSYSNDALIPTSSQEMPNSTDVYSLQYVSHTEETTQSTTIQGRLNALTGR
jgi:hypothetical protein